MTHANNSPLPSAFEIESQLDKLCSSDLLARSKRAKQVLRYLTRAAIEQQPAFELKETILGIDVFGRSPGYDPHKDPIVRVTVGVLRKRLDLYYETAGRADSIRIQIPLGSYLPTISYQDSSPLFKLSGRAAINVANARRALDLRTLPSCNEALRYLDNALEDHKDHPRLLALKAMVHVIRSGFGGLPSIEIDLAESLIEKARQQNYEAWELDVAEAEVRMAL